MRADRLPGPGALTALWLGAATLIALSFGNAAAAENVAGYDGTYAGTQTLAENSPVANYAKCLRGPFKRKLVVKDGAVSYMYNPTYKGTVTGTITPTGDVSGVEKTPAGGVSLSGRIDGDTFTGEVWSLYCTYTLQLKRVP